ncbi:hypothetical protein DIPPA_35363 [Diplonema papillatum]|nr:hypothetical protein DIPPA_27466 [Diplonema papillatum]KAJ9445735.1 hypothetical protein DIPPA_35363 [Diplonema papillatum]
METAELASAYLSSVAPFQLTPLMIASARGHATVVNRLLVAGAEVAAKTETHGTALMLAARYGRDKIVQQLICSGGPVNAVDKSTCQRC